MMASRSSLYVAESFFFFWRKRIVQAAFGWPRYVGERFSSAAVFFFLVFQWWELLSRRKKRKNSLTRVLTLYDLRLLKHEEQPRESLGDICVLSGVLCTFFFFYNYYFTSPALHLLLSFSLLNSRFTPSSFSFCTCSVSCLSLGGGKKKKHTHTVLNSSYRHCYTAIYQNKKSKKRKKNL